MYFYYIMYDRLVRWCSASWLCWTKHWSWDIAVQVWCVEDTHWCTEQLVGIQHQCGSVWPHPWQDRWRDPPTCGLQVVPFKIFFTHRFFLSLDVCDFVGNKGFLFFAKDMFQKPFLLLMMQTLRCVSPIKIYVHIKCWLWSSGSS